MSRGKFIVCEGLDCGGKTTTIKKVIEICCNNAFYSKGLCSDTPIGKFASRFPSTLLFLIELAYNTHFIIKPMLKNGKIVFQDRYIHSIESYAPSAARVYNRLLITIAKRFLLKPDALVHFTVSENERIKRLMAKPSAHHEALVRSKGLIDLRENYYLRLFSEFKGKRQIIDTTNCTIEDSCKKLLSMLEKEQQTL